LGADPVFVSVTICATLFREITVGLKTNVGGASDAVGTMTNAAALRIRLWPYRRYLPRPNYQSRLMTANAAAR